jgi:hypothetical protein
MLAMLQAVDVLVENAGGLSALEAMACGIPVATYRAIPGHGTQNAEAMVQAGVTYWIHDRDALGPSLTRLIDGGIGLQQCQTALALFESDPATVVADLAKASAEHAGAGRQGAAHHRGGHTGAGSNASAGSNTGPGRAGAGKRGRIRRGATASNGGAPTGGASKGGASNGGGSNGGADSRGGDRPVAAAPVAAAPVAVPSAGTGETGGKGELTGRRGDEGPRA